jgi:hypothetical protein
MRNTASPIAWLELVQAVETVLRGPSAPKRSAT